MDAEEALLSAMGKDEIEEAVNEKIDKFHGFLTREVAMKLIAKEKGLLKEEEKIVKLNEITDDMKNASVIVAVERIYPVADYRNGKKSRRIVVKDESAERTLVLWNDDVDLTFKMRTGDILELRGIYEKEDELHLGYSGIMKTRKRAEFSDIHAIEGKEKVHVRGYVSRISGQKYDKFVFYVSDGKNEAECIIAEDSSRGNALKEGDEIILEGAMVRNGKLEMHGRSRILIRRKEKILLGKVLAMNYKNKEMEVIVGKEKLLLDRENSLRFMGIKAAKDLELSTLVTLKKDDFLNRNVHMKITRKNEKIIIG